MREKYAEHIFNFVYHRLVKVSVKAYLGVRKFLCNIMSLYNA